MIKMNEFKMSELLKFILDEIQNPYITNSNGCSNKFHFSC